MSIEAMNLALEALEISIDYLNECLEAHDAKYLRHPATEAERNNIVEDAKKVAANLTALRQAIEQAQKQEPVALKVYRGELCYKSQDDDQSFGMWCPITQDNLSFAEGTKFYTSPPQRQPLTDEQKLNLVTNWFAEDWAIKKALGLLRDYDYEAAHGIKGEA